MADHHFSLPGGLTVCFRTACAIGRQEQLQLGAYVPGIAALDQAPAKTDITIEHDVSDTPRLEDHGSLVRLYTAAADKLPADLYHLFYGVERRELFKRGFYAVHAACVGKDDNFRLIVGHSGSGKTTLAQKLIDQHGLKLFSGNKTIVRFDEAGSLKAVAGTRTMTALDNNLKRYAYELESDSYAPQSEAPVKSISIVRINDGVEEEQTLSPESALHTLYPYFMDAVNADIIVNGKTVLDGAPDTKPKNELIEKLAVAVASIPVKKYSGTMNFLQQMAMKP